MAENIKEIIEGFMDEGFSRQEAIIKAKITLAGRKVNQKKSIKAFATSDIRKGRLTNSIY